MATLLLKELIGTRYITDAHISLLSEAFSKIGPNDELDLAECRFFKQASYKIKDYTGKVRMCNSEDVYLNQMLHRNHEVIKNSNQVQVSIPLPYKFESPKDIIQFIKNIDSGKIWNLSNFEKDKQRCMALVILITLLHPEVVIDLGIKATDVFKQVIVDWKPYATAWDSYIEVTESSLIVTRQVINGKVYIPGVCTISREAYVDSHVALPSVFGKEILYEHPEFVAVKESAARNIQPSTVGRRTMKDFIELFD